MFGGQKTSDDAMTKKLDKDLSDPVSIPQSGIDRANEIMRSGRLFRYGEFSGGESEVAALEREFAEYLSCSYAAALNSCGSAMFVALKSVGVTAGDKVLVNAFTLAPVPGAIEHAGAQPIFVESDENYCVSLEDLESKAREGAKAFLMSHMRGHIADMDAVTKICADNDILLIEDCAHTLGASWDNRLSGLFGHVACFSLQSFKHINAGEGGILTTNDADIAAKAILYSGSYMLYAQNGARPSLDVFEKYRDDIPNFSMRMHELTAAVARPQIALLAERSDRWRAIYGTLSESLNKVSGISVPDRCRAEAFVPSSIQFSMTGLEKGEFPAFLSFCKEHGVDIKWFGAPEAIGFTSAPRHWNYIVNKRLLTVTTSILDSLCDIRIPQSLTAEDCADIVQIIEEALLIRSLAK